MDEIKKRIKDLRFTEWDHGNKLLYSLCRNENFFHRKSEIIIAKSWIIGRSYAASLERQKKIKSSTDNFYRSKVVSKLKNPRLDFLLRKLKEKNRLTLPIIPQVLHLHYYLMNKLGKITKKNVRSFSSKYLHFHLPNLFFLYDSRSKERINKIVKEIPDDLKMFHETEKIDKEYSKFFIKAFEFKRIIFEKYKVQLSPRHLDNVLLYTKRKNF